MINVLIIQPEITPEHIGFIPYWLDERDPRSASQQLDAHYGHGGGWRPFSGFELRKDNSLKYNGDPVLHPIAMMKLHNETIFMYDHAWVCIIQPDRTFEVCRMD